MEKNEHDKLIDILNNLRTMCDLDVDVDGNHGYMKVEKDLFNLLSNNADNAIQLIDTLDFNKRNEKHILKFVPRLVSSFQTTEEQTKFIKFLEKLQRKYPGVNFSSTIFYAQLSANV